MTKETFNAALAAELGLSKAAARRITDTVGNLLRLELSESGTCSVLGLGKIKFVARPERVCRNPRTGERVDVPASMRAKFSPSKKLRAQAQE